jgi:hypothetical protein
MNDIYAFIRLAVHTKSRWVACWNNVLLLAVRNPDRPHQSRSGLWGPNQSIDRLTGLGEGNDAVVNTVPGRDRLSAINTLLE